MNKTFLVLIPILLFTIAVLFLTSQYKTYKVDQLNRCKYGYGRVTETTLAPADYQTQIIKASDEKDFLSQAMANGKCVFKDNSINIKNLSLIISSLNR